MTSCVLSNEAGTWRASRCPRRPCPTPSPCLDPQQSAREASYNPSRSEESPLQGKSIVVKCTHFTALVIRVSESVFINSGAFHHEHLGPRCRFNLHRVVACSFTGVRSSHSGVSSISFVGFFLNRPADSLSDSTRHPVVLLEKGFSELKTVTAESLFLLHPQRSC